VCPFQAVFGESGGSDSFNLRRACSHRQVVTLEESPPERRGSAPRHGWLSPISVWELLTLVDKGRVRLGSPPQDWVTKALERVPFHEAPVTHEVALKTRNVRLSHRDPADRFLVATARVFDLKLVTADERLIALKAVPTLANR